MISWHDCILLSGLCAMQRQLFTWTPLSSRLPSLEFSSTGYIGGGGGLPVGWGAVFSIPVYSTTACSVMQGKINSVLGGVALLIDTAVIARLGHCTNKNETSQEFGKGHPNLVSVSALSVTRLGLEHVEIGVKINLRKARIKCFLVTCVTSHLQVTFPLKVTPTFSEVLG